MPNKLARNEAVWSCGRMTQQSSTTAGSCFPPKPALDDRGTISRDQARELADLSKLLKDCRDRPRGCPSAGCFERE